MLEIRRMCESDIDAVYAIETACFHSPWSKASFEGELKNTLAVYFVLVESEPEFESEQIVGYGGMWTIIDELHITNVAVLPSHRGKGYGNRLMEAMIQYGKDNGYVQMTLEVRVGNQPAIALYEKFGFVSVGTRPGYYVDTGEDACIMWKEL
jgi:ribosomal-protein-alanine N-acetyltransferase